VRVVFFAGIFRILLSLYVFNQIIAYLMFYEH